MWTREWVVISAEAELCRNMSRLVVAGEALPALITTGGCVCDREIP